ncbi:MAG: hypothetical protein JW820_17385 [Spirochaetales bacterium]|nr:hypothetical protein [Spirochaetales bacterium]
MKKAMGIATLALVLLALAGCAAGPNTLVGSAGAEGVVAGFWRGLWHGIIAPVTFVISLFTRSVQMYEVHNNGGWYNFGFLLGVIVIFGGGGGASRGRRR